MGQDWVKEPIMKVIAVEPIRLDEFPNLLRVRVRSDTGLTGLGEMFFGAGASVYLLHQG